MLNALRIGLWVCYAISLLGILLYIPRLFFNFYGFKKQKELKRQETKGNFAILIPARNESRVIRYLLEALQTQNYDKNKISAYIMVTDQKDETIEIAKNFSIVKDVLVVPKNLNNKGKTLDICLKKLQSEGKFFDAYFIFDADNVPEKDFLLKMNDVYQLGYDIGVGRRVNKNPKSGWVANNSILTFSFINSLNNKFRNKIGSSVTVSGSGLYISGSLIRKWGGFPFQSLTEDYELSRYCLVNNIKSFYYERAQVKDEQPEKLSQSNTQRLRWIKGHNDVDNKYNPILFKQVFSFKEEHWFLKFDYLFNLVPAILILVGLVAFFAYSFVFFVVGIIISDIVWKTALLYAVKTFAVLYGVLAFYNLLALISDNDIIRPGFFRWILTFVMGPIFLISWGFIYIKALFVKNLKWKEIKHGNTPKKID